MKPMAIRMVLNGKRAGLEPVRVAIHTAREHGRERWSPGKPVILP